ncbi:MAG: hypothetical protein ACOC90_08150 [Bacteroidota bacterium]
MRQFILLLAILFLTMGVPAQNIIHKHFALIDYNLKISNNNLND